MEVPAYLPSGTGEHLFVHFEKRALTTRDAVERIAAALGVNAREAGFAGLKDKHALTTQWASFFGAKAEPARELQLPGIRILSADFHGNKLRTGHLRGNRFQIRIRPPDDAGAAPLDADIARSVLGELSRIGAPNYYGEQRFGNDAKNLERAQAWLVGGGRAPRDRFDRKLLLSTLQSALFNDWLADRVEAGLYETPVLGDLLRKEDSGGLFLNQDQTDAERRMAAWEVSPTGPMFGAKMRWPEGVAREREQAILDRAALTLATFEPHARYGEGTRRSARVRPENVEVCAEPDALLLAFDLPSGAYATMVLREVMKPELATL